MELEPVELELVDLELVDLELVDLEPGDPRLVSEVLPVLKELRPHLTGESLEALYQEGHGQGLRFTAAYHDGSCVGVAGWRLLVTTAALRKLHVDDLVTTADSRGRGVGHALLEALIRRAQDSGCQMLDLDSGTQRADAHRFYLRERLAITAFHFATQLE